MLRSSDTDWLDRPRADREKHAAELRRRVEAFGDLHRDGMTIIIVNHDTAIAGYCRRVVRLHDGRIVEDREQAGLATVASA